MTKLKLNWLLGFSREQYEVLLALIQQSQNYSSPTIVVHHCTTKPTSFVFSFSSWILDSNAIDHICHFKSLFQNLKPISFIYIQLPNQNPLIAKFSGTIVLCNLTIHNTLFVPEFSVHLISIPSCLILLIVLWFSLKILILLSRLIPFKRLEQS